MQKNGGSKREYDVQLTPSLANSRGRGILLTTTLLALNRLVRNPVMQRYASFEDRMDDDDDDDDSRGSLPSRIGATPSHLALQHSLARTETQATSSSRAAAAVAATTTSAAAAASVSRKSENPATTTPSPDKARRIDPGHLRLQRCIIDDEWSNVGGMPPGKKDAARGLVKLLEKYPKDTQTQVDGWTWVRQSTSWRSKCYESIDASFPRLTGL